MDPTAVERLESNPARRTKTESTPRTQLERELLSLTGCKAVGECLASHS